MRRLPVVFSALAVSVGLAVGGMAFAQDQSTPPAGSAATPDTALCATPTNEMGGTPGATVSTPTTEGTPASLVPCATPINPEPTSETGGTTDTDEAATTVQVEFIDIAFNPDELTIPADTDVTLQFTNNGAAVHNFLIEEPEVFSGDLAPGATSELVVNLPAGEYEFICSIPGHAAAGMVGTLTVE